jgi:hypothetical protein
MFDLEYISSLLQALILATVPVLAAALLRLVLDRAAVERAKLTQEQQYWLHFAATIATQAAEQIWKDGNGATKKAYAISVIQEQADKSGLKLDVGAIASAVESAVFEIVKEVESPPVPVEVTNLK